MVFNLIHSLELHDSVFMQHAGVYTSGIQGLLRLNPDERLHHWFGFSAAVSLSEFETSLFFPIGQKTNKACLPDHRKL